ncbi:hypothetical protein ACFP2T_47430 [Plantactinospora solaniradicis]|uniref:Uncharacterized protein n=1 Tax=Plantactinospora solaniradicis TaxID=1723736 RepID=A0ABW1KT47_9ACTN
MSVTLTDQDKSTLRTAAYGAVTLMSAADIAGKPHKAATDGSIALSSATGLVGHVLAEYPKDMKLDNKSVATIADNVLPALTAGMSLLKQQDSAEADNFRSTGRQKPLRRPPCRRCRPGKPMTGRLPLIVGTAEPYLPMLAICDPQNGAARAVLRP